MFESRPTYTADRTKFTKPPALQKNADAGSPCTLLARFMETSTVKSVAVNRPSPI